MEESLGVGLLFLKLIKTSDAMEHLYRVPRGTKNPACAGF